MPPANPPAPLLETAVNSFDSRALYRYTHNSEPLNTEISYFDRIVPTIACHQAPNSLEGA